MNFWLIFIGVIILIIIILRIIFGPAQNINNNNTNFKEHFEKLCELDQKINNPLKKLEELNILEEVKEEPEPEVEAEPDPDPEAETDDEDDEDEEDEDEEEIEDIEEFYRCKRPFIRNCSKGEKECRRVLKEHFGLPFKSCRPRFLLNPLDHLASDDWSPLELDCYESTLRLACEFQGRQHYYYTPYFHKTREDFEKQKERDAIKVALCKRLGIYLIRVPYSVRFYDIKQFILDRLPLEYKKFKRIKK